VRDRLKLSLRFDGDAMRGDLRRLEESTWIDHFVKDNYEGGWSVVPFRAPAGASHPVQMIYSNPSAEFVDTPLLERCPYFQRVLTALRCPLNAVRLMKLAAGSTIKPHRDHDLGIQYGKARLHVPVITNPQVEFWLNGEQVVMGEGECWYLDLSGLHSVINRSGIDRVHLVIDVDVNEWLEEQLSSAERVAPVNGADTPMRAAVSAQPGSSGLERFRSAVHGDAALQARLSDIEDRQAFIALVVRLAAERGCATTPAEIEQAMQETRRLGLEL